MSESNAEAVGGSKSASSGETKSADNIDALIDALDKMERPAEIENKTFEEQLESLGSHPAFMKEWDPAVPLSDDMEGLMRLKYEAEDPTAKAEAYKDDGNHEFKKKKYHVAADNYTEGIKCKCPDRLLNAVLYTNRAAAQFHIGNFRSAFNDCVFARKFQPDHLKAIHRGSARRPPGVEVQLNYTARQHENATLVYNIVAYPVPKPSQFVWKRCTNGSLCELLPDGMSKFEIDTEGLSSTLTILDVQIEDYKLYQLSVSNGIGDTLVEWLHLRPIGKPDTPTDFHVIQETIGETTAVLTWIPGFDNGSPQEFNVSYGKMVDNTDFITRTVKHDKKKEINYTVENLEPGTNYFVSLFAANEKGSTTSLNDTFLTLIKIIPESPVGPPAAVIGGAVGGGIVAIIVIVGVVVFVIRFRQSGYLKDKDPLTENRRMDQLSEQQQDGDDELPDVVENSMYIPAGDIPKRKGNEIKTTATEDLYSQPTKAKTSKPINSDIYSEVKKPKKKGTSKPNTNKKQYDNKGFEDQTYENHDIQETKKNVNKDGLIYADLEFAKPPQGQRKLLIHGLDDMTVYADVDLTKRAEPLPDSDDDTPIKKEN